MDEAVLKRGSRPWGAVAALIGIMGLMLGVSLVLTGRISDTTVQLRAATDQALLTTRTAQSLLVTLDDATAAQYGYLTTLRNSYLDPYWSASGQLSDELETLDQQAAEQDWLLPLVANLKANVAGKMGELQRSIQLAKDQGQQAALAVVLTDQGADEMTSIRTTIGEIVAQAEAERERRAQLLEQAEEATAQSALALALIGVPLLGLSALGLLFSRLRLSETQRAARLQSERLQSTVNQIPAGVAVFDEDDRLVLWNSSFFTATDLPARLHRSGTSYSSFHAIMATWDPPVQRDPLPGELARPVETRAGRRVMEVWHGAMPGGGHIIAVNDISRRVDAEIIARQAHKMESLGQLTGGVAHDFNNLLQVVSVNLELLSQSLPDRPDLHKRLNDAIGGVERGAKLTRQLLSFARRQPLLTEPVDTAKLLRNIEDILRRTLGPSIEVVLRLSPDLWLVTADLTQLEAALINLAINARDAMPHGGRLTIEAINARLEKSVPGEPAPGEYVIITVTDNGAGMSTDQLARAVEPFYTTKPEGKGTGLGLSMVYGFVNQIGGAFRIASDLGRGTTVQLTFPRTLEAPRVQQIGIPGQFRADGELVLVVEDDEAVRTSTTQTLLSLGYRVHEAVNGAEAAAKLHNGLRPDLLFSDVVMDGPIDGIALAVLSLQLYPSLPVLLTSGYTENPDTQNRIAELGIGLIGKPWRIEDLAQRLRQVLAKPTPAAAPSVAPKPHSRQHVLLVDDDPALLAVTADTLTSLGFEVSEAATGTAALQAAARRRVDILICDRHLPDMDGLRLAKLLRSQRAGLPIIIASGDSAEDTGLEHLIWLQKPFTIRALRASLASVVMVTEAAQ